MFHYEDMPVATRVAEVTAVVTRNTCSWVVMTLMCYKSLELPSGACRRRSWSLFNSVCDAINYVVGY